MTDLYLSTPSDDSYWQDVFAKSIVNIEDWIYAAKGLRLATDSIAIRLKAVWQAIHGMEPSIPADLKLHPIFLMLTSYAAENYLKARIVSMNGWAVGNIGKMLPKPLRSHDLSDLSKLAGATLDQNENDLIDRLSTYAIWAGRYPCPLTQEELRPQMVGGKENLPTFFRGSDTAVSHCLLERLEHLALYGSMPTLEMEHHEYDSIVIQERVTPW